MHDFEKLNYIYGVPISIVGGRMYTLSGSSPFLLHKLNVHQKDIHGSRQHSFLRYATEKEVSEDGMLGAWQ